MIRSKDELAYTEKMWVLLWLSRIQLKPGRGSITTEKRAGLKIAEQTEHTEQKVKKHNQMRVKELLQQREEEKKKRG